MADWRKIADRAARLTSRQTGLAVTFMWRNTPFNGVRTVLKREDVATDEGLYDGGYSFSLLCPAGQFTDGLPAVRKDCIDINGKRYRVLSIDADAVGAYVKLNLGSEVS